MENRLKILYDLQKIDTELDELEELRGDLPETVALLESKLTGSEFKSIELENQIQATLAQRNRLDDEIEVLKSKAEKYKGQLYSVKSNKEYDALMKEIDNAELKILESSEEMDKLADKQKKLREEFEDSENERIGLQKEYNEKQSELEKILKSTEEEELQLKHEREKIVVRINKKDLAIYSRIRKAKGQAISITKKGACSGCHNIVPPQRLMELRKNEKFYTCEFCGRILLSEDLVDQS